MAARPGGMMEGQLKGEVVSQSARHHPMFIPGDFPGLPNELDVDDLVDPFNKFNDSDIVYEIPRIKAKTVGDGKYLKGDVLGEGAYSKVKEMLDCQLLRRRAVKIMKKRRLRKIPNGEQNVRREISILGKLSHPNVIQLIEVFEDTAKEKIYMVLEYCVGGLQELLDKSKQRKFPVGQAHKYFLQLINGLEYLHSRGIVHKDIKPGNLLLTSNETVKITDFGVAEELDQFALSDECTNCQGSPAFQPPEIASGLDTWSGFKADIWASGVTLFQFSTGKLPFEGETIYKLFGSIASDDLIVPAALPAALQSLLKGMLEKDPKVRLSIPEIKNHAWVLQKQPRPLPEDVARFPPYFGTEDALRSTTVLQYLDAYYGGMGNSPSFPEMPFGENSEVKVTVDGQSHDRHFLAPMDQDGSTFVPDPLQPDISLPTIGEDGGDVFSRDDEDVRLPRNLSDPMPEESHLHNISRRVSTVSSQEDVLFPSIRVTEEESNTMKRKGSKRSTAGLSKKVSGSCQQQ